jgi:hypothetical protein
VLQKSYCIYTCKNVFSTIEVEKLVNHKVCLFLTIRGIAKLLLKETVLNLSLQNSIRMYDKSINFLPKEN